MKRMVYIVMSISVIAVVLAVAVGCSNNKTNSEVPDYVGISLSQNHMDFTYCYTFYLREENGKAMFDAQMRLSEPMESEEDLYEIVLEGVEVDKSYLEKLKKLEKKYGIVEYVANYKPKELPYQVMDATINTTSVYFKDNTDKTADSGSYEDELYELFKEITLEYKEYSVSEY